MFYFTQKIHHHGSRNFSVRIKMLAKYLNKNLASQTSNQNLSLIDKIFFWSQAALFSMITLNRSIISLWVSAGINKCYRAIETA